MSDDTIISFSSPEFEDQLSDIQRGRASNSATMAAVLRRHSRPCAVGAACLSIPEAATPDELTTSICRRARAEAGWCEYLHYSTTIS